MRSGFVLEKPVLPPNFRSTRSHSIKRDATPLLYSSKMAQAMLTHDETRKRLIYSTGMDKSILKELQEHKNCPFCSKTLKRFTSRKNNLEYFGCGESCPFFTKASQLPEYVQILARVVRDCYKKFPAICEHLRVATMYLSKSENNYNRPFFSCKLQGDEKCKFFQWADEPPRENTTNLQNEHRTLFGSFFKEPLFITEPVVEVVAEAPKKRKRRNAPKVINKTEKDHPVEELPREEWLIDCDCTHPEAKARMKELNEQLRSQPEFQERMEKLHEQRMEKLNEH